LDSAGNIYVTGSTGDPNFPVTPGAFQTAGPPANPFCSPIYAFATEISSNGASLVYSTFFGSPSTNCTAGSSCIPAVGETSGSAIAVDSTGAVVIGGNTIANQLPVTPGALGQQCDCLYRPQFIQSGFLAKFAPGGKQLDWATCIPLTQTDGESEYTISIGSVAIDTQGNVVFIGEGSAGLFVTSGALQTSYPAANTAADYGAGYVAKVNASASSYFPLNSVKASRPLGRWFWTLKAISG